jgi:hypothetical protein
MLGQGLLAAPERAAADDHAAAATIDRHLNRSFAQQEN